MGGGEIITSVFVSGQCLEKNSVIDDYRFSGGDFGNLRLGMEKEIIPNSFTSLKWEHEVAEQ